jgi:hypothetical protein
MRWILLTLVNWVASLANLFLAPFVVMFVQDDGRLPRWLHWFDTPDNPLSAQVIDRWFPAHDTKFKRWINNVSWLYRNSMYGFSEDVLGVTVKAYAVYTCIGDENVSNKPLHEGLVKRYLTQEGITYWQWYYVKAWGSAKYRRCIRANFGWKLWGDKSVGTKKQIVCSFNPFMGWLK